MSDMVSIPTKAQDARRERGKRSADDRYSGVARAFHWAIAIFIAGMYITNWMPGGAERGSPERIWWLSAHESLGLLVLALSVARLLWRLMHPVPPIHGTVLVRHAAQAGHALLYLATLGLPLAGIGRATAGGGDVVFFGLTVPSWTGRNEFLSSIAGFLHGGTVMNLLLALVAGHVLAALWHHLVHKDGTLRRMI